MTEYEKLRGVIQKANPEITKMTPMQQALQDMSDAAYRDGNMGVLGALNYFIESQFDNIVGREIRLADVLLAIKENIKYYGEDFTIIADGTFATPDETGFVTEKCKWNLRNDNLDAQSDETKQFLSELLVEK